MKISAVFSATGLLACCLTLPCHAAPDPDEPAMPGLGRDLRMQPGMRKFEGPMRQPGAAMPAEPEMTPTEEESPPPKSKQATQILFRDFYRVDEPITQQRLDELAPPLPVKRARPNARPTNNRPKPVFRPNKRPPAPANPAAEN